MVVWKDGMSSYQRPKSTSCLLRIHSAFPLPHAPRARLTTGTGGRVKIRLSHAQLRMSSIASMRDYRALSHQPQHTPTGLIRAQSPLTVGVGGPSIDQRRFT